MVASEILRIEREPSTPEKVAGCIRDLIGSGELAPGDYLPPQLTLAGQMEVSRASVREACLALEASGVIQKMPNGRFRITALTRGRFLDPLTEVLRSDPGLVWDLLEVAGVMVVDAARLAAERSSPQQQARLEELVGQFEQGSRNRKYFVREFHRFYMNFYEALSQATGNLVYLHLGHAFLEVLSQALPYPEMLFLVQPDISTVLYRQHLAIFLAIRDGDPRAAMTGFKRHLDFIEEKLRQILEAGDKVVTPANEA
jgi:GntR family transcriptional repressor for pyruvate dehydrogenase complex